ncbi:hypothetical protein QNE68_000705 [Vibrio fluvialis]|nr:hypothetical protein [Vibrio fluvialis]
MSALVINDEETFLDYVYGVLIKNDEPRELVFNGWPQLSIDITGERYHSSLPTKLMEGFLSLQQGIDKAYATLLYDTSNRQKLTNVDKETLELVFKIEEGSTNASGPTGDWLNKILEKLEVVLENMSGKQKTAAIAIVALSVAATIITPSYFDHQTKETQEQTKQVQLQEETKQKEIAKNLEVIRAQENTKQTELVSDIATTAILDAQAKRDAIVTESIKELPTKAPKVIQHIDDGFKSVVRSVPDATKLVIGTATLEKEDIDRVSAKPDVVKDVSEKTDVFIIEYIKKRNVTGDLEGLLLGVVNTESDENFTIKVDTAFLKDDESRALYGSFEHSEKIQLNYQAKYKNGDIVEGRLIKVIFPDEPKKETPTKA